MAWKAQDVLSQRITFVAQALVTEKFSELCQKFGISRQTGYLWLRRFRQGDSYAELQDRPRRAKRIWNRTSPEITALVVDLRLQHSWAGRKIQKVLERDYQIHISARTVDRILDREHCIKTEDRRNQAKARFQREQPNQLWQMDFKGQYRMDNGIWCYPLSILDDHSRYLLGLHALEGTGTSGVEQRLIETFRRYGIPDQMLMDHGTPWWNVNNEPGLTKISVLLMKQGIDIIHSGIGHPQTQGKVERFHRTLKAELKCQPLPETFSAWQPRLDEFREVYNGVRPHEAIGMDVPAQRYRVSPRKYVEKPPVWNYPAPYEPIQLNSQGSFRFTGQACFVSKALADEVVGVRQLAPKLLVCYRTTYVGYVSSLLQIGS